MEEKGSPSRAKKPASAGAKACASAEAKSLLMFVESGVKTNSNCYVDAALKGCLWLWAQPGSG